MELDVGPGLVRRRSEKGARFGKIARQRSASSAQIGPDALEKRCGPAQCGSYDAGPLQQPLARKIGMILKILAHARGIGNASNAEVVELFSRSHAR